MLGTKAALFQLHEVTLDQLVPADSFYRVLDRALDLSFVYELVADCYSDIGRRSIDPVVFFKLQLILVFEGLRSERQLLRVVADRLSLRWYLGYDLTEPLPDHSSLTRIRDRLGVAVLRRFFEQVVALCQAAGLVWGEELLVDATKVRANADVDTLRSRVLVALRELEATGDASGGTTELGDAEAAPSPTVDALPADALPADAPT